MRLTKSVVSFGSKGRRRRGDARSLRIVYHRWAAQRNANRSSKGLALVQKEEGRRGWRSKKRFTTMCEETKRGITIPYYIEATACSPWRDDSALPAPHGCDCKVRPSDGILSQTIVTIFPTTLSPYLNQPNIRRLAPYSFSRWKTGKVGDLVLLRQKDFLRK